MMPPLSPAPCRSAVGAALQPFSAFSPPLTSTPFMRSSLGPAVAASPEGSVQRPFQQAPRDGAARPARLRGAPLTRPQGTAPPSSEGSLRMSLEESGRDRRERHVGVWVGDEPMNRGAISQLQEFVQGAKLYPMPPN
mmetsp:Transcript_51759/g.160578  ORF Transcript_51759/g.160578 Transcript_51759/m.160578 type:complete len:137 (+) Transcript_51759:81-491(+)